MDFKALLKKMITMKGSDLFVTAGKPICVKAQGKITNLGKDSLTAEQAKDIVLNLMNAEQQQEFLVRKELNFALQVEELGRFRASAFFQRSYIGVVLRRIEAKIPTLAELNIVPKIAEFALAKRGLVIIVGATGAGKSSTLAAMIGHRNNNVAGHIVTIEDPIEFIHEHQNCIITQREVGVDTESFEVALKNTLRQAPDVILIGEIRTAKTMTYALNFSETGHLCLATLHANNANQALDRIINFFPAVQHAQVWSDLSLNLKAIVAQQLIPVKSGKGRIPAVEILLNTPAVADNVKKGEIYSIKEFMAKGAEQGMQTFDQALFALYIEGKITYDDALRHADSENELRLMIKLNDGKATDGSLDGIKLQDK